MAGSAWMNLHVTHVRARFFKTSVTRRIRATFQLLRCPLVSPSPDPTLVVGASNEETGTTDENYLVHQSLMTLNF
ncbi:hypothetical protein BDR03DRAFT_947387 [Suillus americanus]|nr:hypothetical protein BDR03DRAFT_947387 [Suillus americanus]